MSESAGERQEAGKRGATSVQDCLAENIFIAMRMAQSLGKVDLNVVAHAAAKSIVDDPRIAVVYSAKGKDQDGWHDWYTPLGTVSLDDQGLWLNLGHEPTVNADSPDDFVHLAAALLAAARAAGGDEQ